MKSVSRAALFITLLLATEAIAIFQDMVIANHLERLWTILVNQVNILQKLIEDGLSEKDKAQG